MADVNQILQDFDANGKSGGNTEYNAVAAYGCGAYRRRGYSKSQPDRQELERHNGLKKETFHGFTGLYLPVFCFGYAGLVAIAHLPSLRDQAVLDISGGVQSSAAFAVLTLKYVASLPRSAPRCGSAAPPLLPTWCGLWRTSVQVAISV